MQTWWVPALSAMTAHESSMDAHESPMAAHESTIAAHESPMAAHESTIKPQHSVGVCAYNTAQSMLCDPEVAGLLG